VHAVGAWERQINCQVVLSLPLFIHVCNAIVFMQNTIGRTYSIFIRW
jgi:hypothetical protein